MLLFALAFRKRTDRPMLPVLLEPDSTDLDLPLTGPGEYKTCISADDLVGDYGISWRCEDAELKE